MLPAGILSLLSVMLRPVEAAAATTGSEFRDCRDCPIMVPLPSGTFTMGSPPNEEGRAEVEGPQLEITIAAPFAISRFEVTRAEYEAFVRATKHDVGDACWTWEEAEFKERERRNFREAGFPQLDMSPATCVVWDDAISYVEWLSATTGEDYRLPSEAEWEYAARAESTTPYPFGADPADLCAYANGADQSTAFEWRNPFCNDGVAERTAEVGRFRANDFGLHDMIGNLWEWVDDCWNPTLAEIKPDGSVRTTGDCNQRVLRGGSWDNSPANTRSAVRLGKDRTFRDNGIGFRVVRVLPP